MNRKIVYYIAAVLIGVVILAIGDATGSEAATSGFAGFAAAALLGVGLPFAMLGREGIKHVGGVKAVEAASLTPNLVGTVAATKLHVVVRIRSSSGTVTERMEYHELAADGPDVVPTNGAKRVRPEFVEQT